MMVKAIKLYECPECGVCVQRNKPHTGIMGAYCSRGRLPKPVKSIFKNRRI